MERDLDLDLDLDLTLLLRLRDVVRLAAVLRRRGVSWLDLSLVTDDDWPPVPAAGATELAAPDAAGSAATADVCVVDVDPWLTGCCCGAS